MEIVHSLLKITLLHHRCLYSSWEKFMMNTYMLYHNLLLISLFHALCRPSCAPPLFPTRLQVLGYKSMVESALSVIFLKMYHDCFEMQVVCVTCFRNNYWRQVERRVQK